jgi:hypothetical protein
VVPGLVGPLKCVTFTQYLKKKLSAKIFDHFFYLCIFRTVLAPLGPRGAFGVSERHAAHYDWSDLQIAAFRPATYRNGEPGKLPKHRTVAGSLVPFFFLSYLLYESSDWTKQKFLQIAAF